MKRRTTKFNYFDAFASQAELAAKEAELLMLVVENFDRASGIPARSTQDRERGR